MGTNAGGEIYVIDSRFNNNRLGIVPNSGSYELCYPQRNLVIAGNLVYSNNQDEHPGVRRRDPDGGQRDPRRRRHRQHGGQQPGLGSRQDRHRARAVPRAGTGRRPARRVRVGPDMRGDQAGPGEHGATGFQPVESTRQHRHRQRGVGERRRRPCDRLGRHRPVDARQLLRRQRVHVVGSAGHRDAGAMRWRRAGRLDGRRSRPRAMDGRRPERAGAAELRGCPDARARASGEHARRGDGPARSRRRHRDRRRRRGYRGPGRPAGDRAKISTGRSGQI